MVNLPLLHANELPFRHIFEATDGQTSGPKSFKGTIENKIEENIIKL